MATDIPRPGGRPFVTDGGLETDLIFHRGRRPARVRGVPAGRRRARPPSAARLLRRVRRHRPQAPASALMLETPTLAGQPRLG